MSSWYQLDSAAALEKLAVDSERGLSRAEAERRFEEHGPNEIGGEEGRGLLALVAAQFADVLILVLIAAAVVSGVLGELIDTLAILVIVLLNAAVGAFQEYRAQRAIEALRQLAPLEARVLREGRVERIDARQLVPGDLVQLEAGDLVPADLRLIEVVDLWTDESSLTGESFAVAKSIETISSADLPLGDRRNLAFKASSVTRGRGRGLVVATGSESEIGKIARLLEGEGAAKTPLQLRLARFGRDLALVILGICTLLFLLGLLRGEPALVMLLTAISLAVAAIPEALPAVVTVSLALGARKLSLRQALVRRLPAVETLGSVTYICSDKTGTLTENRMTVEVLERDGEALMLSPERVERDALAARVSQALALNNDIDPALGEGAGDPTELALLAAAERAGQGKAELLERLPLLGELSFDSDRKIMTTLHREGSGAVALVKGAPEQVLDRCARRFGAGEEAFVQERVLDESRALAARGYRVLAFACRKWAVEPEIEPGLESELEFLCLAGLTDPPRAEAPAAVEACRDAGIVPVMITGDHPDTARHIAARLGIAGPEDPVLTGTDLTSLSEEELAERALEARVYARVDPEQKIRIVAALQGGGEFVSMTGDGVNDAPALKRADIGVAMGQRGTDVAREAAEMVLLDDNFATIVAAVEEGRRVYDNIRKFLKYTMTSNAGEIWTLCLAPLFGLPLPLLPIQILWINLVTDGLPGLALSAEPAEGEVMRRPPRPPKESIFAHGLWQHMLWVGLLIGLLSLGAQAFGYFRDLEHWQTMVFTTLVVAQLFHALAIRSERDSLLKQGLLSNPQLLGAVLLTLGLQLAVVYLPWLQTIFKTQALPLADLGLCLALGSVVLVAVEFEKWAMRRGWIYD